MSKHSPSRPRSPRGTRVVRGFDRVRTVLDRVPRRTKIAAGAGVVLVAIGIVVVLIRSAPADPEPRARIYRDLDACLLTDSHGIADTPASTVWQGMQDYSRRTAVRVSYVPVIGAETTSDAEQFLAGLIQRRCAVIITTGDTQNAAAVTAAAGTAQTEFVIVGSTNEDHPNLTPLAPDDPHLAESVASTLTQLIPSS